MNKTKTWRKPAGKNNKFTCNTIIGYGKNIIEGQFGFKDVKSGKKKAPLSSELMAGMEIAVSTGGNPNKEMELGE